VHGFRNDAARNSIEVLKEIRFHPAIVVISYSDEYIGLVRQTQQHSAWNHYFVSDSSDIRFTALAWPRAAGGPGIDSTSFNH
jgi:thiamine pyrophosphate-dependent acetolactate synthase large subunit-like protein